MLTRENLIGPWAGLPVAWTEADRFDEETYRGDVARCCRAQIPGVYTAGSTGEFFALELDEFTEITRATIEECRGHGTPAMIGCSSTYTLGVVRRAVLAAEMGADAIQIALPYWYVLDDDLVVPFFKEVAAAIGALPIGFYETVRAKKTLTVDQHRAVKDGVPSYLMLKAMPGTVGATAAGCAALSELVSVFVSEQLWAELVPHGAAGAASSMVYWNPKVIMTLWGQVQAEDWDAVNATCKKLTEMIEFIEGHFGPKGFTDTAYDRLGGAAGGFLQGGLRSRAPYPPATDEHVKELRQWYDDYFPEMLEL